MKRGIYFLLAMIFVQSLLCAWSFSAEKKEPQIIYPKKTELDFDGIQVEGELRNPGEFYFQHRNEERFDSLVKRRKNFHHELLRDAVLAK